MTELKIEAGSTITADAVREMFRSQISATRGSATTTRERAAEVRSGAVKQRADRPSQRRGSSEAGSRAAARGQLVKVELRKAETSDLLEFDGHASVTERGYEMYDFFGPYTEVVSAGAFDETLKRSELDVPLVLGHDQLRRIARTLNGTLQLDIDDDGLRVRAQLDPADADVAYIGPKLRAGLVDEMSFAFRIDSGVWSDDFSQYRIDKVDIHRGDVAIVGYGANPYTDAGTRAAGSDDRRARAQLALALALG